MKLYPSTVRSAVLLALLATTVFPTAAVHAAPDEIRVMTDDPRTPWAVKGLCVFVVAHALSPIDLIADFIPVLCYVDDALLLPGLIWLGWRQLT